MLKAAKRNDKRINFFIDYNFKILISYLLMLVTKIHNYLENVSAQIAPHC